MTPHESRESSRWEHIEIDEEIKKLLLEGIKKAGSQNGLAKVMGYSTPTNIISQFMTAPKYKRFILKSRLEKLKKFLRAH
jgi:hypothetical protein